MPPYVVKEQKVYALKEHLASFPGKPTSIRNFEGEEVFLVESKGLALQERQILKDSEQNEYYIISEDYSAVSIQDVLIIIDAQSSQKLYKVQKSISMNEKNKVEVHKINGEEKKPAFVISGGFLEKEFTITNARGKLVCQVKRRLLQISNIANTSTYAVQVEKGQDAALMLAFAITIESIFREID